MVKTEITDKKKSIDKKKNHGKWKWGIVVLLLAIAVFFPEFLRHSRHYPQEYTGLVEGSCCNYEAVNNLNGQVLHPLLQELVKTPFFRYFKVKLWCDCPFWDDDGMCQLRDCSVCECSDKEFPEAFKRPGSAGFIDSSICQEGKPQASVDRTLDNKAFRGWIEVDNPWTNDDETDNGEMTYVNLLLNPERYTGYSGPSARRIWDAIYSENCPKDSIGACQEREVLFKLISGLHSSISVHIAADYLLDETTNLWGSNMKLMHDRVLKYSDRVKNMYFTYLFILRAVTKAADYLEQAEYGTGNKEEDLKTQSLIRKLIYNPKLQAACPFPFDEAKLWQGQGGPELKQQKQMQFRNIRFHSEPTLHTGCNLDKITSPESRHSILKEIFNMFSTFCNFIGNEVPTASFYALMDCVGCEKCRLWGKLQILGLGTAFKILFSVDGQNLQNEPLQLQRNEVIALLNLLNKLSESIKFVHKMSPAKESSKLQQAWHSVSKSRARLTLQD